MYGIPRFGFEAPHEMILADIELLGQRIGPYVSREIVIDELQHPNDLCIVHCGGAFLTIHESSCQDDHELLDEGQGKQRCTKAFGTFLRKGALKRVKMLCQ
ncbi:hypothetical protein SDC9_118820 [bioreactor metagenome]|uniref:Uncharacterized protein n=1 Tax=bioreactor metagenome TaxID=1076179 RepID=A0A645C2K6_9ZZZZ